MTLFADLKAETDRQGTILNLIRAIAISKLDKFVKAVST